MNIGFTSNKVVKSGRSLIRTVSWVCWSVQSVREETFSRTSWERLLAALCTLWRISSRLAAYFLCCSAQLRDTSGTSDQKEIIASAHTRAASFRPLPAETLHSHVSLGLQGGHPHQEPAQDVLLELLHPLGGQVRVQGVLSLELLHVGLELLLQRGQSPLGLLQALGAEPSGALRRQQRDLDVPQEFCRLFNGIRVAPQRLLGLRDLLLKCNTHNVSACPYYRTLASHREVTVLC